MSSVLEDERCWNYLIAIDGSWGFWYKLYAKISHGFGI